MPRAHAASTYAPADDEIRVGVSSCLLGQNVRFDGGHKHEHFLTDTLGQFMSFVAVCPEVEVGMGIPRPTIRLERRDGDVRLVAPKTGVDHTDAMRAWSRTRIAALAKLDLSGYVLKKDSPSCGMERVKVYDENLVPSKSGRGVFAQALIEAFPHLPVEEEGRLHDPELRESFVERIFAYRRLRGLFDRRWSVGDLVAFHTREKLSLLAHEPRGYQALGRLVAAAKATPREQLARDYQEGFMAALEKRATPRKHVNVLQHMAGYFKRDLEQDEKRELQTVIEDFGAGLVPLVAPLTLVRHYVRRYAVEYLKLQTYLEPHPKELMLRNHC